jgi:hypothetical protein
MVRRQANGALWTKRIQRSEGDAAQARWSQRAPGAGLDETQATELVQDSYDPRQRPWYQGAQALGEPYWSDVYVFWSDGAPGITLAAPWFQGETLRGVSLGLVRQLLERQAEPRLGGETRELTLWFSDIEGFTPITERLGPMRMAEHLGTYLGSLSELIQQREGTVVQYVGDEIMAFWGAPVEVASHVERACDAALAVQERPDDGATRAILARCMAFQREAPEAWPGYYRVTVK